MSKQTDLINIPDAITVSGSNVGIGTSSPSARLSITNSSVGDIITATGANGTDLRIGNHASNNGGIYINSQAASDDLRLQTQGSTRMTIDSSGNVLVGTTNTTLWTATSGGGILARPNSSTVIARESTNATQPLLILNETGLDGTLQEFRKDGSAVGIIGTSFGDITIGGKSGLRFDTDSSQYVIPYNVTDNAHTTTVDLGTTDRRFKDLYLSGGVYLGGTVAANKLDDYEEGLHTYTLTGANSGSATIPIRSGYTKLAYTKIGRMVTITGKIETSGSHSTSGALRLSLPFTAANLSDAAGIASGSCFIYRTSQSIYDNPVILPSTSSPYGEFYYNTTSGDVATIQANNTDAQFEILVSFSYFTNA